MGEATATPIEQAIDDVIRELVSAEEVPTFALVVKRSTERLAATDPNLGSEGFDGAYREGFVDGVRHCVRMAVGRVFTKAAEAEKALRE